MLVKVNNNSSLRKILSESDSIKPKCNNIKLVIKKSVDNMDERKIDLMKKFIIFCLKELGIKGEELFVGLTGERGGPITTTASYAPGKSEVWVYVKNRPMMADPMRSVAHELMHFKQDLDGVLNENSGNDGSLEENEANSFSGLMIRKFGRANREIYE